MQAVREHAAKAFAQHYSISHSLKARGLEKLFSKGSGNFSLRPSDLRPRGAQSIPFQEQNFLSENGRNVFPLHNIFARNL